MPQADRVLSHARPLNTPRAWVICRADEGGLNALRRSSNNASATATSMQAREVMQ